MSLRKIAALTALLSLILMFVSSLLVYLAPEEWYMPPWQALHVHGGMLGAVSGLVYLLCSVKRWTASLREYKRTGKRIQLDLLAAGLIILWLVLSSLFTWWPWSMAQSTASKTYSEEGTAITTAGFPQNPPFRYGNRALKGLCDQYGVQSEELARSLKSVGIESEPEWSLKRIAEENDMEIRSLYDAMFRVSNI